MNTKKRRSGGQPTRGAPQLLRLLGMLLDMLAALVCFIPKFIVGRIAWMRQRVKRIRRESRSRNAPESNRVVIQLVLLAVGQLRMHAALVRDRLRALRRLRLSVFRSAPRRTSHVRRALHPFAFGVAMVAVAAVVILATTFTIGTTVRYEGTVLETVGSESEARRALTTVENITTSALGEEFTFDATSIQYETGLVRRSEVADGEVLEDELTDQVGLVTNGYSLYVDGDFIGATQYEGALEALLAQKKAFYVTEDTISAEFEEEVEIVPGYVPVDSITNLGSIAELLNRTKSGEVTYTVVGGDTWSAIAKANNMTNDALEALNPGYDIDRLNIGDVLLISNAVPYLTIVAVERQNYDDNFVPYDIEYVDDKSMYQGNERVLSPGEYGTSNVVVNVTYVNGVETEREVLASVVLVEPVTEQRARGTKERPSWYPTGTFRWPATGRISSYFGYRNTGIKGASTDHKGIDIGASYGAAIYAADGGTVTYSGWWGSGGYTIIIDHGNGFKTYYEHCSSLLVKVGAHVYKGQQIAKVGRSGVTSGPHCHFGIMKNGSYVNPLNYLP